ncbi:NUDIX hydrolase [Winogradskyella sp. UBA3174]|uniref:NUDIX hydrolase n=1 Tax=Winogradskyella sp. UBA3174 TaxID=1947785 RepID=UPI0025E40F3D|nr:NUDIX domain-containing protein [Winogradskyella sp. UBA3174]|tara:strand:+ start:3485 stop:4036 length:552 start_codon:yes stop_codon:yes gene_type:complete
MDEYIDIVTSKGEPTGKSALKSEAHKNGWYHNTIHLWLYTTGGDILLQQRSHKKLIYPLLWDVSVAGHIDTGETFIEAALRETEEEIGLQLQPKSLQKIGIRLYESSYKDDTIQDNEFHQIYIAELNTQLNQLIPQEDEVEALKLVSIDLFKDLLKNSKTNNHFIATNSSYYTFVLEAIKKRL